MSRFALTKRQRELLPSDEDVRFYEEHGWYLSRPLFTDEELDRILEASHKFYAGHRDRSLPVKPERSAYWEPSDGDVQRHNDYICYENDTIRNVLCKPLIGAVAARLAKKSLLRLWSSTLIYKPPRAEEPTNVVPWHTDRHHWQVCTSDDLLTAFIPLHDCDEESGTLIVIDGSHKWKELPAEKGDDPTLHFADRPRQALETALEKTARYNGAVVRKIPVVIPKGCASFHHSRTYHGSESNLKPYPRRVVTVRFQGGDNHWRPFLKPNGEHAVYHHDGLVRKDDNGEPDYTDPSFCPVVWEEPGRAVAR